jgi:hypothetical protein
VRVKDGQISHLAWLCARDPELNSKQVKLFFGLSVTKILTHA